MTSIAPILVAEDNPSNAALISLVLENAGYRSLVVADGEEVVKQAKRREFSLILMDVQMPKMTGIEACQSIRLAHAPICDIPILALTSRASPNERARCLEAGMDGFIIKPFEKRDLMKQIEAAMIADKRKAA